MYEPDASHRYDYTRKTFTLQKAENTCGGGGGGCV